jgi:hypothetical protein
MEIQKEAFIRGFLKESDLELNDDNIESLKEANIFDDLLSPFMGTASRAADDIPGGIQDIARQADPNAKAMDIFDYSQIEQVRNMAPEQQMEIDRLIQMG